MYSHLTVTAKGSSDSKLHLYLPVLFLKPSLALDSRKQINAHLQESRHLKRPEQAYREAGPKQGNFTNRRKREGALLTVAITH